MGDIGGTRRAGKKAEEALPQNACFFDGKRVSYYKNLVSGARNKERLSDSGGFGQDGGESRVHK